MSRYSTSYDSGEQRVPAPRQALAYVAGAAAVLFAIGCAILAVLFLAARRDSEESAAARAVAESKQSEADRSEQESRRLMALEASARQLAETRADAAEQARQKAQHERDEAHHRASDAEKTARAAESKRLEAKDAEQKARTETQVADEQRKQEMERRREAARQIIKLQVAQGGRLLDDGDLPQALLWYAEALRTASRERLPEDAHRLRLAIALSQHPKLVQAWSSAEPISTAQLSPDGRRALIASGGAIRLWDTTTGKQVGEALSQELPAITFVAFSPDGTRIVSSASDPREGISHLHLRDVATGKPVFAPVEVESPVSNVIFSADGKRLVTVGADRGGQANLRAYETADGKAVGKGLDHAGNLLALSFSADGREVLMVGTDHTLRRWNPVSGDASGVTLDQPGPMLAASFSPDRTHLVTAGAGVARVWTVTGRPMSPPLRHVGNVLAAAFSADGRRVVTQTASAARVWDAKSGEPVGDALRHSALIQRVMFSPDGRHVLTASSDGRLRLWNAGNGSEAARVWQSGPVPYAQLSPDGGKLLTLEGKVVRLWDLTAAEPIAPAAAVAAGERSWFSPDGQLVVRGGGTDLQLYTLDKNQPVGPPLKHKYAVADVAFSADGKRLATATNEPRDDGEGLIQVWDTATGQPTGEVVQFVRPVTAISFRHDGAQLLSVCADFKVRVLDVATGQIVGKPLDHNPAVQRALFSPDGKLVATATADFMVRVWDVARGEQESKTLTHHAPLTQMLFSADSKRLLTADQKGIVCVWEAASGDRISQLPDLPGPATGSFSADGKRLVTICESLVRIWDADKGTPITPPLDARDPRAAISPETPLAALSPDGHWLATAAGNRFRLWDAATGEPVGPSLAHASGPQTITQLTFTPDGKLVTGTGPQGDPRSRQTWDFRPDGRAIAEVQDLVELLTGHRLDDVAVIALTSEDTQKAWTALRPRYPTDFVASPERARAWSRRGLDECERQENWSGAVLHLDQLIAAEPGRPELYLRRAADYKAMRQWDRAVADYTRAIDQQKERPDLWATRAAAYVEQGQWDRARADLTKAIELSPNDAELRANRGRAHAELGQWDAAATDFGRAIALGREDAVTFQDQALARLGAGDLAGYKQICSRMARRFGGSQAAAQVVGWTCALGPDALPDLKPLVQHAERARTANAESLPHLFTLALLLYRTGQLQPALQQLEITQRLRTAVHPPIDWLLLAMTQHRLGRGAVAKEWLSRAVEAQETATPRTWQDRLALGLLRKEAESLLGDRKP